MRNKVKIVDFNRRSMKVEEAEQELADLLNMGYSLVGQSEGQGFVSYTLVKQEMGMGVKIGADGQPPAYMPSGTRTADPYHRYCGNIISSEFEVH